MECSEVFPAINATARNQEVLRVLAASAALLTEAVGAGRRRPRGVGHLKTGMESQAQAERNATGIEAEWPRFVQRSSVRSTKARPVGVAKETDLLV